VWCLHWWWGWGSTECCGATKELLAEAPGGVLGRGRWWRAAGDAGHLLLKADHGHAEALLLLADVVDGAGERAHHFLQTVQPLGQIIGRWRDLLSRARGVSR
jgi:hypothetical protein